MNGSERNTKLSDRTLIEARA